MSGFLSLLSSLFAVAYGNKSVHIAYGKKPVCQYAAAVLVYCTGNFVLRFTSMYAGNTVELY